MDTLSQLKKTFVWNTLANKRVLAAIEEAAADAAVVTLLSHALMAEYIWFLRIEGFDTTTREVWPALSPAECRERCGENDAIISAYLTSASEAELARDVSYKNSRGDAFTTSVADILTHVTHHSAYHRAQINRRLRECGAKPAVVDFISFARGEWPETGVQG
ncbi:MAG: DinB family protein [Bacteroidia bacterium]|nr:DinB family protein [Bacteroidia bacterium]